MDRTRKYKTRFLLLLFFFILLAILASYSSSHPDGLERVLLLFQNEKESEVPHFAPFSDYHIHPDFYPGINLFLSALLGMGIIWALVHVIYKYVLLRRRKDRVNNAT
jgi:hypothetical protein